MNWGKAKPTHPSTRKALAWSTAGVAVAIIGVIALVFALEVSGVITEKQFSMIALALLVFAVWWHSR